MPLKEECLLAGLKQVHYHRHEAIEKHCDECGQFTVDGWLRCADGRPLCDPCYFTRGELEEDRQWLMSIWEQKWNQQDGKVWG